MAADQPSGGSLVERYFGCGVAATPAVWLPSRILSVGFGYWIQRTGWLLLLILITMVATSLPGVRRSGRFEVFYFAHLLYVPFYVLLLVHASRSYRWLAIPLILFAWECLIRWSRACVSSGAGRSHVTAGVLLPSDVVQLMIARPSGFSYNPGDWIFLQIPRISRTEWHPFTLSSAPEDEESLTLHVRVVGQWTKRLQSFFQDQQQARLREQEILSASAPRRRLQRKGTLVESIRMQVRSKVRQEPPYNRLSIEREAASAPAFFAGSSSVRREAPDILSARTSSQGLPSSSSGGGSERRLSRKQTVRIPFDKKSSTMILLSAPEAESEGVVRSLTRRFSRRQQQQRPFVAKRRNLEDEESGSISQVSASAVEASREARSSGRLISVDQELIVKMDGPFGSPTTSIFATDHAVLVGAGIGVTPFASILQSIMNRYIASRITCPACDHSWTESIPTDVMRLKKVDFVWINRDQRAFEWFASLLSELEATQDRLRDSSDRFLDIHTYVTSGLSKSDPKAVGLHLALDLMFARESRDLVTGLKTRSHTGRPDWRRLFADLQRQAKGQVTVFFCGPPALARDLRRHCADFAFAFRKEVF